MAVAALFVVALGTIVWPLWGAADAAKSPKGDKPSAAAPAPAGSAAVRPASSMVPPPKNPIYRVGAGDVLHVDVFDDTTVSGDYTVGSDGKIVLPLLGATKVGGMPTTEIKDLLTRLLEKDYLYDPNVSVSVKEYKSQKVSILGNVGKPGTFFLDSPTQIFDLLSKAEGISAQQGDVRKGQTARIVRQENPDQPNSPTRTIIVDLYDLMAAGKEEANIYVESGDVIYVERTEFVHVVGEVKRPGSFPFEQGMTVLKAISIAGGATKKGSAKNSIVKRIRDGKEVRVSVNEQDLLEPDDIVEVPLSFW